VDQIDTIDKVRLRGLRGGKAKSTRKFGFHDADGRKCVSTFEILILHVRSVGKSSETGFEFFFCGGSSLIIIIMIFETSNAGFLKFAMLAVAVPVVEVRDSRAGELRRWRIWYTIFFRSSVADVFWHITNNPTELMNNR
jgi:hypothetical protein